MKWLIEAGAAVLIVWTWYRFRSIDRTSRVFRQGILGLGFWVWLTLVVGMIFLTSKERTLGTTADFAFYLGITSLPICLWMGYWWGKGMDFFFAGAQRNRDRSKKSDRP